MPPKKVWVTWMPSDEAPQGPQTVVSLLRQYGLNVVGDKWTDDLGRMIWLGLGAALLDVANADLWLIIGGEEHFERPSNRYALSLLTATLREGRGGGFPIVGLGLDRIPDPATLPTLMQSLPFITLTDQSWPAKVVAAAFNPKKASLPEFRLSLSPNPLFGQWFEVGPRGSIWTGVMFGVTAEATITHHAVGPRGRLPERTTLEYQIQGMQAQIGQTVFTAWSVQNQLRPEDSYYIKVEGFPARIIFGGHPGIDQAEVFVIDLK